MDGGDLPGGVYAEIDGRVYAASHVRGQPYITLIDDGTRLIDRAAADRLFGRTVSGRWQGEPVTVWAARTPGTVRVQFDGNDFDRARTLGMRGDRTLWDLEVLPSEVTVTSVDEVDLH
ncbi:MAG TPA: hypothetical protein VMM60_11410 [Ilumatobacter sp.]|nr:hypothetical protein [Ilumatobacter sp.]